MSTSEVGAAVYESTRSGFKVTYDSTNTFPTDRELIGNIKYVHVVYDDDGLLGHKACPMIIEDPCTQDNILLDIETAEAQTSVLSSS